RGCLAVARTAHRSAESANADFEMWPGGEAHDAAADLRDRLPGLDDCAHWDKRRKCVTVVDEAPIERSAAYLEHRGGWTESRHALLDDHTVGDGHEHGCGTASRPDGRYIDALVRRPSARRQHHRARRDREHKPLARVQRVQLLHDLELALDLGARWCVR